jgi:hypothetical protein
VSKSAVRCKFAVTRIEELALNCFVIAVRLRVKQVLLLAHFINVAIGQWLVLPPHFSLAMGKMAPRPALAAQASHEVLADISLELHIERGELRGLWGRWQAILLLDH